MRKKIYALTAVVLMTGIMATACAPKTDAGAATTAAETTAAETTAVETTVPAETGDIAGETDAACTVPTDETLDRIHDAVQMAYGENYIPNMPYDTTALEEVFGVDAGWYDAVIAEGPMISVQVETFVGIKAKPDKVKDVAAALEAYRKDQIENAMQYPMNMVKLEASQVVTQGNYVFFVMLGSADEAEEAKGEEAALASAKKNNQIAIDAIDEFFKK